MNNRKKFKENGKKTLKHCFLVAIIVCFIISFISGNIRILSFRVNDEGIVKEIFNRIKPKVEEDNKGIIGGFLHLLLGDRSPVNKMYKTAREYIAENEALVITVTLVTVLIQLLFYVFVRNILMIGEKRFFMEARLYKDTKISRIFYPYKNKKFINTATVMIYRDIFQYLWLLTIIGFPIKYYSYRMIPFIVAENPDVEWKEAFKLSKSIMKGHKWKYFKYDLSFIGWFILSGLTFGLVGIFFLRPYKAATDTEVYMSLRKDYLKDKKQFFELLNDPYIDSKPKAGGINA